MESQDERSAFARPSSPESPVTPPPQRVVRKGSRPGEFGAGFGGNSDHETNGITNTDTEEEKNNDQNPESTSKSQSDQIAKVTITKKAEGLMSELVTKVNEGFEFGRVNRHQLMSWILTRFADDCSESDIKTIRADHFDEMSLLELSLKRFKQNGGLPPELKKMLLAQVGAEESTKRAGKKGT